MIQTNTTSLFSYHSVDAQDEVLQQLLKNIDKGTETVNELRSLLTVKTAELNQIVHQLQTIEEVLTSVEYETENVENALKDVRTHDTERIYGPYKDKKKCYEDTLLINKLKTKLRQLGINPTFYFHPSDNAEILQKSAIDLEVAKTISVCMKTDYRQRNLLMKNKQAQPQIQQLGAKIREEYRLWKMYTRGATFSIQNKDLDDLLSIQDQQLSQMEIANTHLAYTRHTSSSLAKLNRSGSLFKLRKFLPTKNPFWSSMAKVAVQ
ncbi:hypothetical protein BY458DRAFT_546282 [Sporodiniella umbellata]|nr:hypothetical protein BY458DRAFT_546282 [Sporodiniella umbellata]